MSQLNYQNQKIQTFTPEPYLTKEEALTLLTPWDPEQSVFFRNQYSASEIFRKKINSFATAYAKDPFVIVAGDASQAEVRMAAELSGEEKLLDLYRQQVSEEEKGVDVSEIKELDLHYRTASYIWGKPINDISKEERKFSKTITFAVLYGAGAWKIALTSGISIKEAETLLSTFWKTYSDIRTWVNMLVAEGVATGFVTTPTGRRKAVPNLKDKKDVLKVFMNDGNLWSLSRNYSKSTIKQIGREIRQARNFPVQSFTSDMIVFGTNMLMKECKDAGIEVYLHTIVHDSVVCSVQSSRLLDFLKLMRKCLEKDIATKLNIKCPLRMDLESGFNCDSVVKIPFLIDTIDPKNLKEKMFDKFCKSEAGTKITAMADTSLYLFKDEFRKPEKLTKKELEGANMTEKEFNQAWLDYGEKWQLTPENLEAKKALIAPTVQETTQKPKEVYIK